MICDQHITWTRYKYSFPTSKKQVPPFFKDPSTCTLQDIELELIAVQNSCYQTIIWNEYTFCIAFPSDKSKSTM